VANGVGWGDNNTIGRHQRYVVESAMASVKSEALVREGQRDLVLLEALICVLAHVLRAGAVTAPTLRAKLRQIV
jgi:hypothetical protein